MRASASDNPQMNAPVSQLLEAYKDRFLSGDAPNLADYLHGLSDEEADELRAYLASWMELKEMDGTLQFLAEQPSTESQLAKLQRRINEGKT